MAKSKSSVRNSTPVTRNDDQGYKSLISGIYSRKTPTSPARITKSKGDQSGANNPIGYKAALLGKKGGYATGSNRLPDNPLGLKGGVLSGRGLGTANPKPNFTNNPIGYSGGLLVNKKKGGK